MHFIEPFTALNELVRFVGIALTYALTYVRMHRATKASLFLLVSGEEINLFSSNLQFLCGSSSRKKEGEEEK